MASSGQILNILANLEKGVGDVGRQAKSSRVREATQHRGMQRNLQHGLSVAASEGQSVSMLSGLLSTALALTGAGIPMVMAAQLAGSLVTGHMGKKKAETAIGKVKGLGGTKFGEEVNTYKDEIGKYTPSGAIKGGCRDKK